jgi:ATP-dependent phosphofructokinase / diphosphate-dependent phosphofructokinase
MKSGNASPQSNGRRRIGLMTGGGDAPGLNGIIEATVRSLAGQPVDIVGICDGFDGVYERRTVMLGSDSVLNAHMNAGTILGSSNKSSTRGREEEFLRAFSELKLDGLIAAGGDGTFEGLSRVIRGLKLIGVPKTIDNDLQGTDVTFGFDTACAVVSEAVDALRATADAHKRVFVVEAMGRTTGWIAGRWSGLVCRCHPRPRETCLAGRLEGPSAVTSGKKTSRRDDRRRRRCAFRR